jgi:hypothetical protein
LSNWFAIDELWLNAGIFPTFWPTMFYRISFLYFDKKTFLLSIVPNTIGGNILAEFRSFYCCSLKTIWCLVFLILAEWLLTSSAFGSSNFGCFLLIYSMVGVPLIWVVILTTCDNSLCFLIWFSSIIASWGFSIIVFF